MPGTMFLETIRSEGLAALSYMVGHKGRAAVIDARRDTDVYLELERRYQCRITHIFETHKNEDFVTGSIELSRRTGADIYHGEGLDWGFGQTVKTGDSFALGDIALGIIQTPGHTDESISITLADTGFSDAPVAVFTGDALFIGDTGRADFYPERAEEVAGLLYDSIFERLLPLGDHVLLLPAHGAGSVCGSGMAAREFSSLGYERRFNPGLQVADRDEFIGDKLSENHDIPPYFKRMEGYNRFGDAPPLNDLSAPRALDAERFAGAIDEGATVLDIRKPEAFCGSFIPGSLNISVGMLSGYAGYFLRYDQPILIVGSDMAEIDTAVRRLARLGYDRLEGYLRGGMHAWETSGRPLAQVGVTTAAQLKQSLADADASPTILDVRTIDEYDAGHLDGAVHAPLSELLDRLDDLPRDREIVTFCGSGLRASIAASILHQHGVTDVANNLGSMAACKAIGCEVMT